MLHRNDPLQLFAYYYVYYRRRLISWFVRHVDKPQTIKKKNKNEKQKPKEKTLMSQLMYIMIVVFLFVFFFCLFRVL